MATISKIELLMTTLFIYAIYKDIWFVDFRVSQHLTLLKEVFSTFEEFILHHKIYFGNNSTLDVCGKDIIVFNLSNEISKVH
jgi:hypothetical protein